jgi:hypothetical protein
MLTSLMSHEQQIDSRGEDIELPLSQPKSNLRIDLIHNPSHTGEEANRWMCQSSVIHDAGPREFDPCQANEQANKHAITVSRQDGR